MKISKHLPHFTEAALLVVTGAQDAVIYMAKQDQVKEVDSMKLRDPALTGPGRRSDRRITPETRQEESGPGADARTRSFIRLLAERMSGQAEDTGAIYLFCPANLHGLVDDALPKGVRGKVMSIFFGNYRHQHPFVLLSTIMERQRVATDERRGAAMPAIA